MGVRAQVCIATYASIQQFALTPGRKLTRKVTARMRAEATGKMEIRPTGRKDICVRGQGRAHANNSLLMITRCGGGCGCVGEGDNAQHVRSRYVELGKEGCALSDIAGRGDRGDNTLRYRCYDPCFSRCASAGHSHSLRFASIRMLT